MPHLDRTESVSQFGLSQVTCFFDEQVDLYTARQEVTARLQNVQGQLPGGVSADHAAGHDGHRRDPARPPGGRRHDADAAADLRGLGRARPSSCRCPASRTSTCWAARSASGRSGVDAQALAARGPDRRRRGQRAGPEQRQHRRLVPEPGAGRAHRARRRLPPEPGRHPAGRRRRPERHPHHAGPGRRRAGRRRARARGRPPRTGRASRSSSSPCCASTPTRAQAMQGVKAKLAQLPEGPAAGRAL